MPPDIGEHLAILIDHPETMSRGYSRGTRSIEQRKRGSDGAIPGYDFYPRKE